eukprot:TRINITY_DN8665_c0_g1_i2.p1 TRINITY_DN8665_c0_g1~~TRINITY_DN8665_c0_g1_i2.p1  ORF type:complete len:793 (-),score=201.97 TRINITY_DN8665_c0_g1_i2:1132-3480(-)
MQTTIAVDDAAATSQPQQTPSSDGGSSSKRRSYRNSVKSRLASFIQPSPDSAAKKQKVATPRQRAPSTQQPPSAHPSPSPSHRVSPSPGRSFCTYEYDFAELGEEDDDDDVDEAVDEPGCGVHGGLDLTAWGFDDLSEDEPCCIGSASGCTSLSSASSTEESGDASTGSSEEASIANKTESADSNSSTSGYPASLHYQQSLSLPLVYQQQLLHGSPLDQMPAVSCCSSSSASCSSSDSAKRSTSSCSTSVSKSGASSSGDQTLSSKKRPHCAASAASEILARNLIVEFDAADRLRRQRLRHALRHHHSDTDTVTKRAQQETPQKKQNQSSEDEPQQQRTEARSQTVTTSAAYARSINQSPRQNKLLVRKPAVTTKATSKHSSKKVKHSERRRHQQNTHEEEPKRKSFFNFFPFSLFLSSRGGGVTPDSDTNSENSENGSAPAVEVAKVAQQLTEEKVPLPNPVAEYEPDDRDQPHLPPPDITQPARPAPPAAKLIQSVANLPQVYALPTLPSTSETETDTETDVCGCDAVTTSGSACDAAETGTAEECPAQDSNTACSSNTQADAAELAEEVFNPYLFIKMLPPLPSRGDTEGLLPPKREGDPVLTLVLDLDETLIHSSTEPMPDTDISFNVTWNDVDYSVYAKKRPHLEEFLQSVARDFEVLVFTASQDVYADKLLNIIDPGQKCIKHRIFRDSCVNVEGNYLKDLTVLGRDLSKVIIVDNSPQAFGYQIDNGVPIESWFDREDDTELLKLLPFLQSLHAAADVRPHIREEYKTYQLVDGA